MVIIVLVKLGNVCASCLLAAQKINQNQSSGKIELLSTQRTCIDLV